MAWDTAGNIVNDAAVELGLVAFGGAPADPFGSQDANIGLLCQTLKRVGKELTRERQWTHLQKEYSFATIQGTASYDLPADFQAMVDQTWWNRTNRLPVGGPLSPQEWQYLKARLAGVVFTVLFRPMEQKLYLYPDTNTPGGYTIAFEYVSSYWVKPNGQTTATAAAPTASSDTILFDAHLVTCGLKLAWRQSKGFDTTVEQDAYNRALAAAVDNDSPAPVLRLNRESSLFSEPLIGEANVPITGLGT